MVGFECIEETWKEPNEVGHVCLAGQETPAVTLGLTGAELLPVPMADVTTSLRQCGVKNIVITSHDGATNSNIDCANEYTTANHYIDKVVNRAISRIVKDITTIDDDVLEAHVHRTHDSATITQTDAECPYVVGLKHAATSTEAAIEVCGNCQQNDATTTAREETAICVDRFTQLDEQVILVQDVGTLKEAISVQYVGTMKETSSVQDVGTMKDAISVQDVGTTIEEPISVQDVGTMKDAISVQDVGTTIEEPISVQDVGTMKDAISVQDVGTTIEEPISVQDVGTMKETSSVQDVGTTIEEPISVQDVGTMKETSSVQDVGTMKETSSVQDVGTMKETSSVQDVGTTIEEPISVQDVGTMKDAISVQDVGTTIEEPISVQDVGTMKDAISVQDVGTTIEEPISVQDVGTMKELSIESLQELARMNRLFPSSVQDVGTLENDQPFERHANFTPIPVGRPSCTLSDANQLTTAAEHCAVCAPDSVQQPNECEEPTSEFTTTPQQGTDVSLNDSPTWNTEEHGTIIDREAESHDSRRSPKCVERIATFLRYTGSEHEHDNGGTVWDDGHSIQHVKLTEVNVMSNNETAKLQESEDVSERLSCNDGESFTMEQCDYSIDMWSIEEPMADNRHDLFAAKEVTQHESILEPEGARHDDVSERLSCNDDESFTMEQCDCSMEIQTDEECIADNQQDLFAGKEVTQHECILEPEGARSYDVSERLSYNGDENSTTCDCSIEIQTNEECIADNRHDLFAAKEVTQHECILEPEGARHDDVSEQHCCNDDENVIIEQCACSIEIQTNEECIADYQHDVFGTKEEAYYESIVESDQLFVINSMETWNDMTCSVKEDVCRRLSSPDVGLSASVNIGDQLDIDSRNCVSLETYAVVACGQYEDMEVTDPFLSGEGPSCEMDRLSPCDSCMLVFEFETFDPEVQSNRFMEPLNMSHNDVVCCLTEPTTSIQERKCWCDRLDTNVDRGSECDDRDGATSLLEVEQEKDTNVNNGGVDEACAESVVDIIRMIDESSALRTSSDNNIGRRERKCTNVHKDNEIRLSVTYFGHHRICLTQCRSSESDESSIRLDGVKPDGVRYMNSQHRFVDVGPTTDKPSVDTNWPGSLSNEIPTSGCDTDRQQPDTTYSAFCGSGRNENLDVNDRIHNPDESLEVSIIAPVADGGDTVISTTNKLMVDNRDVVEKEFLMSIEAWKPVVQSNATIQVFPDDGIPTDKMETIPTIDDIRAAGFVAAEQIDQPLDNSDIIPSEIHDAALLRLHQHTSAASEGCSDSALESCSVTDDVRPHRLDTVELITSGHVTSSDTSAAFDPCGRTFNEFSVRVVNEMSKRTSHINSEEPSLIPLLTHSVNTSCESGLPQPRKHCMVSKELPSMPAKYDACSRTVAWESQSGYRSRLPLPHSSVLPQHVPSVAHPRSRCPSSQHSLTDSLRSALPRLANETQRCNGIDTSAYSLRKAKDASVHGSGVFDGALPSSDTKPTVVSSDTTVPGCPGSKSKIPIKVQN